MGGISTTVTGMVQGAAIMRGTLTNITGIMARVEHNAVTMSYWAKSAKDFQTAIADWRTNAQKIANELDVFATHLQDGSNLIANTEADNQSASNF